MRSSDQQVTDALIDAVVELGRSRDRSLGGDRIEAMLRAYYGRASHLDLDGKSPADLYGATIRHLRLGDSRRVGETRVRAYNPQAGDDGWQTSHSVIDVVTDDMPFLVDSVTAVMNHRNLAVHVLFHPMVEVSRDDEGRIIGLDADEGGAAESFLHYEVDRVDADELATLETEVRSVLADVRATYTDWQPMRTRALELAAELEAEHPGTVDAADIAAATEFLRWMADDNFTFIGYREYDFVDGDDLTCLSSVPGTGLGVMRSAAPSRQDLSQFPAEVAELARRPFLLNLTKTNEIATVHRPVRLDYVGVKRVDGDGRVTGERRFIGLYTSVVYNRPTNSIPVVRDKVAAVLRRAGFRAGTHDASHLANILEQFPRDELFQISTDDLEEICRGILDLRDRREVRLFVRPDSYGRFLSCLVFVPRDRHSTDVRLRIQEILLEAYAGTHCEYSTEISDAPLARLHIVVHTPTRATAQLPDREAVQARLARVTQTWEDLLRRALISDSGEDRGLELFGRYRSAFPTAYTSEVLAETAVSHIARMEALDEHGLVAQIYEPLEARPGELRCELFRHGEPVTLSQILPLLHDLGAVVTDERPYQIAVAHDAHRWIYDIGIRFPTAIDQKARDRVEAAMLASWSGRADSDGFARLVTRAGLDWRQVVVVRAYARYLRQIGATYTVGYLQETLSRNPAAVAAIVALFEARFAPDLDNRDQLEQQASAHVDELIDNVASLDEDRILRSLAALVRATVRTNHHRVDTTAGSALALKLDPGRIPGMPRPVPAHEIFVFGPHVEGVHLRAGRVARGGLRWSDRRDDYRTEVLGLLKAQNVKNAVIVPVGAKGGFVAKQLPDGDREAVTAEVVRCYRSFISALLDVTDNREAGRIVPPEGIVRHDGDDSYLVVAADKGTATFSDTANEIATGRSFWLGDAFASGGSTGYDHKKLAITARGAWLSVERHFRELGIDVANESVTVIGVGDMSGDVFGNGMLRSPHLRLVAAFDHRHVFIDPQPDAAAGFAERSRLFALARSSWADYDTSTISAGGGVFERTAKSIEVSAPMAAALGAEPGHVTPNELIRMILRAPADLLWNGGIGTYVRATTETDRDVGDRSNDPVRIVAADLRVKVIGEGGNLGLTQRARIEFARSGGRINTDAIDNSGGVDCSDHEVNLKILLDDAVRTDDLTVRQRNELLARMADEVCELVLDDNDGQLDALVAARTQAAGMTEVHIRHLRNLSETVGLDRDLEALPDDEELARRRTDGTGLTQPELAVMLAYTKNQLTAALIESDLPDDAAFDDLLLDYFPREIRENHARRVLGHPLRRELVATQATNHLVNRGGPTMVRRLAEETGASVAAITRAHRAAWEVFELEGLWRAVRGLDNAVPASIQVDMHLEIKRLGERAARWFLRGSTGAPDVAAIIAAHAEPARRLTGVLADLLVGSDLSEHRSATTLLTDAGVPADLAATVAGLGLAFGILDLAGVAQRTATDLREVAEIYFLLDERLDLGWLRRHIVALPRDDHWQSRARSALRDDFYREHAALTAAVTEATSGNGDAASRVEHWVSANPAGVGRCRATFSDIKASGSQDLARVSIALRELRELTPSL
ncbi:MAG: NAD-glutamate dehydrogenase [Acidimicrobiales bacterium]